LEMQGGPIADLCGENLPNMLRNDRFMFFLPLARIRSLEMRSFSRLRSDVAEQCDGRPSSPQARSIAEALHTTYHIQLDYLRHNSYNSY
jgi:hypothetical protein